MENSKISWTDDTWNPWVGCDKVGGPESECANCYIDRILVKQGRQPWGEIHRTKTWGFPRTIQRKAEKEGNRPKVFTCSLSDWFHSKADEWRPEVWKIIRECPDVDFLVLTKRAHRIAANLPPDWGGGYHNVWLGVSAGRMYSAHRVDKLREVPAQVKFISAEPLLESLAGLNIDGMQWVIAGGESGPNYRRMQVSWAEELRVKCEKAGIAFFFKQAAAKLPGVRPDLLGKTYHDWPVSIEAAPAK